MNPDIRKVDAAKKHWPADEVSKNLSGWADLIDALDDRVSPTLRREWRNQVIAQTQILAGRLTIADRDEAAESLDAFAKSLPLYVGALESAMLRQIVMDVELKASAAKELGMLCLANKPMPDQADHPVDVFRSIRTEVGAYAVPNVPIVWGDVE